MVRRASHRRRRRIGYAAWDAYFAFDANASWQDGPEPLVGAGSTIIDNVGGLERVFVPLLR